MTKGEIRKRRIQDGMGLSPDVTGNNDRHVLHSTEHRDGKWAHEPISQAVKPRLAGRAGARLGWEVESL